MSEKKHGLRTLIARDKNLLLMFLPIFAYYVIPLLGSSPSLPRFRQHLVQNALPWISFSFRRGGVKLV